MLIQIPLELLTVPAAKLLMRRWESSTPWTLFAETDVRVWVESTRAACLIYLRYAHCIDTMATRTINAVHDLAHIAVRRALEYMARTRQPLVAECIVRGVHEGRLGKYVTGMTKTKMLTLDESMDATVEGVCGGRALVWLR